MIKSLSVAAIVASLLVPVAPAHADTQKGRCTVVTALHGGKRFALMKCDRASSPGNYIIRSQIWEKDDKAAYNKLARFSGRRFTCDITYVTTSQSGMIQSTRYNVTKCR